MAMVHLGTDIMLSRNSNTVAEELQNHTQDDNSVEESQCDTPQSCQEAIALRRRYNAELPVSRLPNELLCHTFLEYITYYGKEEELGDLLTEEGIPFWKWWLILTRVCRHWRTVVLSTPMLWAELNPKVCRDPSLVKKFIFKSNLINLNIRVVTRHSDDEDSLQDSVLHILRESSRIAAIRVQCPLQQVVLDSALQNGAVGPCSQLRELTVRAKNEDEPSILPLVFHETPRFLTRIDVSGVRWDWAMIATKLPATVTYFSITQTSEDSPTKSSGSLEDVMSTLQKIPRLETLQLTHSLPSATGPKAIQPILLRNLKKLIIVDSSSYASALIQSLVSPSLHFIHLRLIVNLREHQLSMFFPYTISTILSYRDRITYMMIEELPSGMIIDGCMDKCQHSTGFEFRFQFDDPRWTPFEAWIYLLDDTGVKLFSSLTELDIYPLYGMPAPYMTRLFAHADQVETLKISVSFLPTSEALYSTSHNPSILPRLKTLTYLCAHNNIRFREEMEALCTALEKRKVVGYGLSHFILFSQCELALSNEVRSSILAAVDVYDENFPGGMGRL